jgi:hypothetical protein
MSILEVIKRVLERESSASGNYPTKLRLLSDENSENGFSLLKRRDNFHYNHRRLGKRFHFIKWVA